MNLLLYEKSSLISLKDSRGKVLRIIWSRYKSDRLRRTRVVVLCMYARLYGMHIDVYVYRCDGLTRRVVYMYSVRGEQPLEKSSEDV